MSITSSAIVRLAYTAGATVNEETQGEIVRGDYCTHASLTELMEIGLPCLPTTKTAGHILLYTRWHLGIILFIGAGTCSIILEV